MIWYFHKSWTIPTKLVSLSLSNVSLLSQQLYTSNTWYDTHYNGTSFVCTCPTVGNQLDLTQVKVVKAGFHDSPTSALCPEVLQLEFTDEGPKPYQAPCKHHSCGEPVPLMTWWICSLSLVMNTDIWIHCSCRVVLVLYRLTGMPSLCFFHVPGGMDRSCVIVQSYCVQQTRCPMLEWSKAMVLRLGTVCNSTWNPQIWVCLQWSCFSRRCPSC